jgi:hypothetical protein
MRRALEAIGEDEHRSVQASLAATGAVPLASAGPLESFDARHARSRLGLLALASLEPRSLETGEPIDVSALLEKNKQVPVILPRVRVKEHEIAGTLANRALHDRHRLSEKLSQATNLEILASHAVTEEAHLALIEGDVERFLSLRAEALKGVVARFLTANAEFGADDGPPIDSLTIEDLES